MAKRRRKQKAKKLKRINKKGTTPSVEEWKQIAKARNGLLDYLKKEIENKGKQKTLTNYFTQKQDINNATEQFLIQLGERNPDSLMVKNVNRHGMFVSMKEESNLKTAILDLLKQEYDASLVKQYSFTTKKGTRVTVPDHIVIPYDKKEEQKFIDLVEEGRSNQQIANELGRSKSSISKKKYRLKKKGAIT